MERVIKDKIVHKLPLSFRKDIVEKTETLLKSSECSTFIFMPGVGKHRIARFLVHRNGTGDILNDYNLYLLNCTEDSERILDFLKSDFYKTSEKRPVIILNDVDMLFELDDILDLLLNLRREHNVLLSSFSSSPSKFDLTNDHNHFAKYDFLTENIIYSPPNDYEDNLTFIEEFAKAYEVRLSQSELKRVSDLSGDNQTLSYQLLRLMRDGKISSSELDDLKKIFAVSEEMKLYCKEVIDSLGNLDKNSRNESIGFYSAGKIFSQLVDYYLNNFEISVRDSDEIKIFTPQELAVFKLLKETSGAIVSRERIADLIWEDESSEKYSDWAIDTLMKNLRRKTEDNELGVLKTKRGVGYYLE